MYNIIFRFPTYDVLEPIVTEVSDSNALSGILTVTTPALPKLIGDDTFLGWNIAASTATILKTSSSVLTKNDTLSFAVEDNSPIYVDLNPSFMPSGIMFNIVWDSFGPEETVTPSEYKVMTVVIDQSISDPELACSYADDALSMTAGSDKWDDWFGYYPVVLDNGSEYKKLNPNNLKYYLDGSAIGELTTTQDAMIARPIMGWRIITQGTKVYVSMTDQPNAEGFVYHAHYNGNKYVDKFYEGIYLSSVDNSSLNSHTNRTPLNNISLKDLITALPQIRPTGYQILGYYQRLFWQIQYLLKYKNTDS